MIRPSAINKFRIVISPLRATPPVIMRQRGALSVLSLYTLAAPAAAFAGGSPLPKRFLPTHGRVMASASSSSSSSSSSLPTLADLSDPREWMEEVEGEDALAWVKERNSRCLDAVGQPESRPTYDKLLSIMDSTEKIPYVGRVLNGFYYNFWQDDVAVRGVWRRCTPEEYKKASPDWETVLDLDALSAADGVTWVWGGSTLLDEGPDQRKDRVIIALSRGGADATIAREFDLDAKEFVPVGEGGFEVPECKSNFCYKDRDTLLIGGAFGDEEMTDSGYPRTVYEWKRGTPLSEAVKVYEGEQQDVSVGCVAYLDRGVNYEMRYRSLTFYTARYELSWRSSMSSSVGFQHVRIPEDAQIGTFGDQLLITLRSPWLGHEAGAMVSHSSEALQWPLIRLLAYS